MRSNNRGFSLVELIVALAIFAIAGVAVFGFMVNSSNTYKRTNVEVKLQYEQQLAVNQIRDMVVESDKGIYFDEASQTLALYGAEKTVGGSTVYPVTVIRYMAADEQLYFGTKDFATVSDVSFADIADLKLLAEDVTEFKVDLTNTKNDKVKFQLTFKVGDKTQTVIETVALRNRLIVSNQVDTIWGEQAELIESFIKSIAIGRGTEFFSNGEEDEIGKSGESVVVSYFAKVTANEESDREYAVSWSIDETISGVGVSADGNVTVASTVPSSTRFTLRATSMDDPSKSAYITIVVTDLGVYPKSAELEITSETDGNGYRTYMLLPTLHYSNNTSVSDCELFTWSGLDSLPEGCNFNPQTGKLILTPNANGYTFTVRAQSKERKADGTALWADLVLEVKNIPEYVTGPTVKIIASNSLSRGGYVFPTMVLTNATSSNYTYAWSVEPYYDEETTKFDTGEIANSDFNLISLAESSGYNSWNVKHEMSTGANRRSIALNCAPQLNWSKTFKVMVTGTATDEEGNVIAATPKIVTVEPVSVSITRYGEAIANEDNNYPVLTDSRLRYEDWYWANKTPDTDDARWQYTRRWFLIEYENIYITANDTLNTDLEHNYLFKGVDGVLLTNDNVGVPETRYMPSQMLCGFRKQMINWEKYVSVSPASLKYSITLKDYYGNAVTSNAEDFTISYEFYNPEAE